VYPWLIGEPIRSRFWVWTLGEDVLEASWGLVVRRVPLRAAQVARKSPPVSSGDQTSETRCGALLADPRTSGMQSLVRKRQDSPEDRQGALLRVPRFGLSEPQNPEPKRQSLRKKRVVFFYLKQIHIESYCLLDFLAKCACDLWG
jgi:hypothetical protein